MTDLTLIIPAKKEKESLPKVLQNLEYLNHKIIVSLPKNDLETIKSELGWYPKTTLDEGLIKIYNDVKERVNYEKVSTNTE